MKFERDERVDYFSKKMKALETRSHVSLWTTNPTPHEIWPKKRYHPRQNWYVCLNWREQYQGEEIGGQANLTDWFLYPRAVSEAIAWGKELNLIVVKHKAVGNIVLWAPNTKSTQRQKLLVASLRNGKKAIRPRFRS